MTSDFAASLTFLVVQVAGVSLTTALLLLLARQTRRPFLRPWTAGWALLAVGLLCLLVYFSLPSASRLLLLPYFAGEYLFAVLLARGLGAYRGRNRAPAYDAWLAVSVVAVSAAFVFLAGSLDAALRIHAFVFAFLLSIGLVEAWRIAPQPGQRLGRGVTVASLGLLVIDFLAQAGVRGAAGLGLDVPLGLLHYNSLTDLVLETALGFGLVVLVMEVMTADLAASNRDLSAARDKLEDLARLDPLTHALNRHAFQSMLTSPVPGHDTGCAVLFDIDNLKQINDTRGHAAGDQAIRDAARLIRRAIRADDLLFRWGGDEFLAVLFGMSDRDAETRFRQVHERSAEDPQLPRLSWGIARFDGRASIGTAIEAADRAMYEGRHRRRRAAAS
jgi:diguanylate cyclase (GGDEF)-like protein